MQPKTSRYLNALQRQPVEQVPVWVMRQAGRYLPEYRQLRQQAPNFMDFCRQPELAMQATLQPLARFPLDAAILFSDILTVADVMGTTVHFETGVGPKLANPARCATSVEALITPDVCDTLGYVADAIKCIQAELPDDFPLIGFCGSPWTIACYQICGGSQKDFWDARQMSTAAPELLHKLLQKITRVSIDYLLMQVEAGVDALMVFDSWGGLLAPHQHTHFSLQYMQQIITAVKAQYPAIPITLFSKGATFALPAIAQSGCQGVGIDWMTPLPEARALAGNAVTLQGNLDPAMLLGRPENIIIETRRMLESAPSLQGYIANLGHGIYKDTPIDNMACFIDTVQSVSRELIAKKNNEVHQ